MKRHMISSEIVIQIMSQANIQKKLLISVPFRKFGVRSGTSGMKLRNPQNGSLHKLPLP